MVATEQRIVIDYLTRYINDNGGRFADWYCGITDNIERRLFTEHNVARNSSHNHRECHTNNCARNVEQTLLNRGCDGGGGGGGVRTVHVYVYRKTPNTRE